MSFDDRSIVISALRAAFQPAVKSLTAGQLDIYLELELSGTSVQTKARRRTSMHLHGTSSSAARAAETAHYAERRRSTMGAWSLAGTQATAGGPPWPPRSFPAPALMLCAAQRGESMCVCMCRLHDLGGSPFLIARAFNKNALARDTLLGEFAILSHLQ